jgi:hypothetical protein
MPCLRDLIPNDLSGLKLIKYWLYIRAYVSVFLCEHSKIALKQYTGLTNRQIGQQLGNISYSAVAKVYQRFSEELRQDKALKKKVAGIMANLSLVKGFSLFKKQIHKFETRYQNILDKGYNENPLPKKKSTKKKRGRPKKSKARNLLERLDEHRKEIVAFMYDFKVPFDNNLAERDLCMAKVQQKISGTFRS